MPDNDRVLLIGFHPEDGRLILARNNPDHARYTVVLIPGMGTGPDAFDGISRYAENLYRKLAAHPDDEDVSVVTWADYVPPQSPEQARDPSYAEAGAPRLASFLVGLRVTAEEFGRHKKAARIVVIARDYGGLVAGLAARDHGLDADALVFLDCATAGVASASALRVSGPIYATDGRGSGPGSPEFGATLLRSGPLSLRNDPFVRHLPSLRRIILGES